MNTRVVYTVVLVLLIMQLQAQDAYVNESKYWFYRYRLLTEFLVNGENFCGEPSGVNIPCGSAYSEVTIDPDTYLPVKDENEESFDTRHNYGDGSSFLGYYIGVLATEHKLLKNNGAPQWQTDKVKQELYYAMKAFERLDKNAERLINSVKLNQYCDDNANGFFLRDDVPASFNDPIKARQLNNGFRYRDENGNRLNRQFTSNHGDRKNDPLEALGIEHAYVSVDQCADLMVGFSLVTKLMDNESWAGYPFKYWAREYTHRMVSYIKDNDFFIPIPGQDGKCTQHLNLEIPANENIAGAAVVNYFLSPLFQSMGPQTLIPPLLGFNASVAIPNRDCLVKHGGIETRGLAYPFAQAGNMIYNDKLGAYKKLSINPNFPTTYHNTITGLTKPLWTNLDYPVGKLFFEHSRALDGNGRLKPSSNDYNNAIIATFAAIGNSWETGFSPTKVLDQELTIPNLLPCWKDGGQEKVCGWWPFDNDCHYVDLPPYFGLCDLYLGRVQVHCYNMPSYIQTNAFYELTSTLYPTNSTWPPGLSALLSNAISLTPYCIPIYNATGYELVPRITYNTTGHALSKYADLYDLQLFPLLHRVLHNSEGDYSYNETGVRYRMNTAPCNGPHYKPFKDPHVNPNGLGGQGVEGWNNDNNFQKTISPTRRNETNASFPGLDYMLYYNLYSLIYGNSTTADGYRNQMNVNVENQAYPYIRAGFIVGSDLTKKKEIAYDELYAHNVLVNAGQSGTFFNGNVTYKAGERIKIENMVVKAGANFKAHIEKSIPCTEYNTARVVSETSTENSSSPKKPLTDEEYQEHVKNTLEKEIDNYKASVQQEQKKHYQSIESYLVSRPVTKSSHQLNVNAYPNPFTSDVTLSSLFQGLDQVEVMDAIGNQIFEKKLYGEKSVTIPTENFSVGVYYVKVYAQGNVEVKKIVKAK